MPVLIDKKENDFIEYDATYIDPKAFGALNNPLAEKIIQVLSTSPMCAIDISRELSEPEHKIYYHLNKLSRAGIIKLVGTEKRYGMVAQLYDIVSPVVAAKINENGKVVKISGPSNDKISRFFYPFVENGNLNAKIIIGDPSPHGRYGRGSHYGNYIADFTIMLGSLVTNLKFPYLKFDTEANEIDLRNNLILIGSHFNNIIIDNVVDKIHLKLEENSITSYSTNITYDNNILGYVIRMDNPFDMTKKLLIIGGVTGKGTRSSIVSITREFNEVFSSIDTSKNFIRLIEGIDKDGDRVIDSVKIIE